ncbi:hypothetical protein DEDE109153_12605 [Deinococcus deserti]|uniref:GH26 domain-containing protein n=1 Tax=Deinococcus deserti (strain DSM 17065 / CIP 109153 / LMG 22923 / VCD115) TaxID=546414 RepID=C1CXN9_DEIDV|nr:hypothetical protein [Deinococcus deserti]ACO44845.1 conserved hypothetical protein, precursor [Deinococcus deserti VCD115]
MRFVLPLVLLTLTGTPPSAATLLSENPPTFLPASPVRAVVTRPATTTWPGPQPRTADSWYALGRQSTRSGDHARAAQAFLQAAALNPSAANWRAAGDAQVKLGDYEAATRAYEQAAARYRARGDDITARALEHQTAPYRQVLRPMLLTSRQTPDAPKRLARLEPARGILLGTYVDASGVSGSPPLLAPALRDFAVAFRYWKFTASTDPVKVFPGRFAQAVKANAGALHLALEPGMPLSSISDAIILRFAQAAGSSGVPIFLRFASEMNDPQNAWSRDPALYRTTFARVARLVRSQAPNVAMVWMPMPGDLNRMAAYYPGADAVDWAGLSLYSLPFENGDVRQPRLNAHPLDLVRAFYDRYALSHPIQLSEYAASHRSGAAPGQDYSAFAAEQLREVYWGAWLTMPRLKNINWLDLDMLAGPNGNKVWQRRNDYRLFGSPAKWSAFGTLRSQDAFLTRWDAVAASQRAAVPTPWPAQLLTGQRASGALWVQLAQPAREVRVRLDGRPVQVEATLPHRFTLEAGLLTAGTHRLDVQVLGAAGQVLLSDTRTFEAVTPR